VVFLSIGGFFLKGTIKLNKEFRYAYNRGKKVVTDRIVMHYNKNRTPVTKYGITVSTVIGKAHMRNRIKRLIREAYKDEKKLIKPGYNIIFVARSKCAFSSLKDIKSSMNECLLKAELKESML